ncbi:MAG: S41 family peptidase [bacterium]|nr:S41 family peptidase [bacterium]
MNENEKTTLESLSPRHWVLVILIVGIFAFLGGTRHPFLLSTDEGVAVKTYAVAGIGSGAPSDISQTVEFDQFWRLWRLLKDQFYKQPLDDSALLWGAMKGMAEATGDPYTVFFEPVIADEFQKSLEGKFEGIGAEIGIKDGQLEIVSPLPGMPAEKAGLLARDAILKINDEETTGMSVEQAVTRIRGDRGTSVVLHIGRLKSVKNESGEKSVTPETFDVTVVRDTIVVASVRSESLDEGIQKITITNFNSDTAKEFSKAVDDALAKGDVKGIVLDMRNNPGGFLDRAISIAGEWVGGDTVVIEQHKGVPTDEFHGTGSGRLAKIPTAILVNGGSASASEIVAGALQDYGLGTVIGEQTYGKGSVQDYSELANGSAVKITVAEWLTPKGRFLNEVGITPDIIVERTEQDYHDNKDPQLEKALETLK